ncbi:MAG: ABC transporter permease [Thermomicrobiales bacterium]
MDGYWFSGITVFLAVTVRFSGAALAAGRSLAAVYAKMAGVGGGAVSEELLAEYRRRFGLDKSTFDQYVSFWRELFQGNLGYSIASFPTRVSFVLRQAVPWTIGLLTFTTLVSWLLGSLLGAMVGWSDGKSKKLNALVPLALVLYTTPYYILAILLVFLFAYRWAIFPLSGAFSLGAQKKWSWVFAKDVIEHAALPALSIILVSLGWWFLSMRSLIIFGKGTGLHSLGGSKGTSQAPDLLVLRISQCLAAPDDRPGALVWTHRRWCVDHRGDLRLSGTWICYLQRHSAAGLPRHSGGPCFCSSCQCRWRIC